MRKAAEGKGETFTFFPNIFKLSLTTKNANSFSEEGNKQFLNKVIKEFRNEFDRKYGEESLIIEGFPDGFLSKYDYIEIVTIFKLRLTNLANLLASKIKTVGFFKSEKNGLSFSDIKFDSQIIIDVELASAEAVIKNLNLTRDKNILIGKYKNQLRDIGLQISKKESEGLVARNLLKEMRETATYNVSNRKEQSGTSVVLDSSFIQNLREDDYYSLLLKTAMSAGIDAGNLKSEKIYLEQEILRLKAKNIDKSDKSTNLDGKTAINEIHNVLEKLMGEIAHLSKMANGLNREYLEYIIDGAINIIGSPTNRIYRTKNLSKIIVLSGIVGLFFSIFSAFFLEYIRAQSS